MGAKFVEVYKPPLSALKDLLEDEYYSIIESILNTNIFLFLYKSYLMID